MLDTLRFTVLREWAFRFLMLNTLRFTPYDSRFTGIGKQLKGEVSE
jgi:hypothetical protein